MLSDIFSPLPPFFHFSVDIKIPLFSYVFWCLPLFFTVLSVLMWLTLSDMIWPSTFFLIFFIQLSQGQVLRCILTLSPNFYIVCLVIKIQFLQTNFGASSYSFHFFCLYGFDVLGQNLTVSLFSSFLIQLSQGQCSPTYFDPSPSFLIFLSSGQSSIFSDIFLGFPPLFLFLVCFDGVDALRHNMTVSLLFFIHFLSTYHKVNVFRHILTLPPLF